PTDAFRGCYGEERWQWCWEDRDGTAAAPWWCATASGQRTPGSGWRLARSPTSGAPPR
ncbi:unnamed protein product, partial [Prorocentrum cordatum]